MNSPLLSVDALCANYGVVRALSQVSLSVYSGEIVTIIGANGAGKTTLLKCISSLHRASHGRIVYDGNDITGLSASSLVKGGIAHVPEGRRIFPRLTVRENLELGAYTVGNRAAVRQSMETAVELFPVLAERFGQLGGTLSGGEQQMLAIGRAIMCKPRLLLMDEPSMGVAPLLVEKIFETMVGLNRLGLTIVLVEQNAQKALSISQRAYVLETGAVVINDAANVLLNDARIKEAYLGG